MYKDRQSGLMIHFWHWENISKKNWTRAGEYYVADFLWRLQIVLWRNGMQKNFVSSLWKLTRSWKIEQLQGNKKRIYLFC